jgi:glycosyltransferase involved in cell wall biosynthesis
MVPPSIDILLATYNGASFLGAQIESLLAQKDVGFRILVHDDASSDNTQEILERYRRATPEVFVIFKGSENLGAVVSFSHLLGQASAPYVALCDQDDVWAPDKLRILLARMREMESEVGKETPVLAHCDLSVVDEGLHQRHASFWRYSGFNPPRTDLPRLLIKNTVTGCASLINRALVELALPVPPAALMHDYWLALLATAAGRVVTVDEPLVAYRQHPRNAIGARPYGWRSLLERLAHLRNWDMGALRKQAAAVAERCGARLPAKSRVLIGAFVGLPGKNWLGRRWCLLRHGIFMPGFMRNFALFFWVRLGG